MLSHAWHRMGVLIMLLCVFANNYVCSLLIYCVWHVCCGLLYFAHLHLDLLITVLPLCISSYRFELWVPIDCLWLGMHLSMLSLNGALPFYNTILAYVLHELSKAQCTMLFIYCVPVLVLYSLLPYITYIRTRPRWVKGIIQKLLIIWSIFFILNWLVVFIMNYIVLKHNSWSESGLLSLGFFDFSLIIY